MPTLYHINEFAVESEIDLPFDASARSACLLPGDNHIHIRRASLADIPCTMRKVRRQLIYDVGDGFLLEPPGLALHIDFKGRVLTIDAPDEKVPVAGAWAIHAGLGAATLTHGGVPLHGAGLELAGKYVALMADSGTGKSTLSWFLLQRGAQFGNDDLIPAYLTDEKVVVYPSVSLFPKLSREAVDRHGLNVADLLPADYGTGEEEYYIPLPPSRRVPAPAPLSAVFLLRPCPKADDGPLRLERLAGLVTTRRQAEDEAARTLERNLHALWLIGKWMDKRRIGALCHSLAARVPIYELSYPKAFALLPELGRAIERLAEER